MIKVSMRSLIDDAYGTFDDDAHEIYRYDDTLPGIILMSDNHVVTYETVGGMMFDWVPGVVEDED